MTVIAYNINQLITELQKIQQKETIHIKNYNTQQSWKTNHNLCIENYNRMTQSRKKIIQQRDNLQRINNQMQKKIDTLQKYQTLQHENTNLYQALKSSNATITRLEKEKEQLRREKEEYQRRYNLFTRIIEGKL